MVTDTTRRGTRQLLDHPSDVTEERYGPGDTVRLHYILPGEGREPLELELEITDVKGKWFQVKNPVRSPDGSYPRELVRNFLMWGDRSFHPHNFAEDVSTEMYSAEDGDGRKTTKHRLVVRRDGFGHV